MGGTSNTATGKKGNFGSVGKLLLLDFLPPIAGQFLLTAIYQVSPKCSIHIAKFNEFLTTAKVSINRSGGYLSVHGA